MEQKEHKYAVWELPPKERTIIEPPGGWQERAVYLVEAAFSSANPIHTYVFYTGFLNGSATEGTPGGYNEFMGTGDRLQAEDAHYIKPIQMIAKVSGPKAQLAAVIPDLWKED